MRESIINKRLQYDIVGQYRAQVVMHATANKLTALAGQTCPSSVLGRNRSQCDAFTAYNTKLEFALIQRGIMKTLLTLINLQCNTDRTKQDKNFREERVTPTSP
jgi:hypothetical protein